MKLNELSTSIETRRVITYNVNQTKAVYHNIAMRHAQENIYVGIQEFESYGIYHMAYAWFDDFKIGIAISSYRDDTEVSDLYVEACRHGLQNSKTFIERIKSIVGIDGWITLTEVELLKTIAPELVENAIKSREAYRNQIEKRKQMEEEKRREEEAAYIAGENKRAENMISQAIEIIKNGGRLANKTFSIYTRRYDYKSYCVVGYLMEKYGIDVPIRTKGWIINNLAEIVIEGNSVTNCRYYKSGKSKGSKVVWKYLDEMICKVKGIEAQSVMYDL